jgi:hypothetical protein
MLARTPNSLFVRSLQVAFFAAAATVMASCATKEKPPLIADPSNASESSLPWNEQQSWEQTGQLGALSDKLDRQGRR